MNHLKKEQCSEGNKLKEYHLIKNLSQSIANKHKTKRNDTIYEAFGNYVAKALSELDKVASNLAQNKINNIIFQAQAGLLTQEIQTPTVIQPQPQRNYFHPIMPGTSQSQQHPIYGQNSVPYREDHY